MKIVSVEEMVRIEKASDAAGHSYDAMMELAGRAVAAAILRHMSPWDSEGGTLVLVGPGNNGGDGLVAARYLRQWDPKRPVVVYCWKRDDTQDSNYDAVRRLKIPIVHAEKDSEFAKLQDLLLEHDVIVDALLGTGVSRPIGGSLADLLAGVRRGIELRREEEARVDTDVDEPAPEDLIAAGLSLHPVADFDFLQLPAYGEPELPQIVAVDCPSGLNCDTGHLDPAALMANLTITFANPKVGHFISDGPAACGSLLVADIGTDPELDSDVALELVMPAYARSLLPRRPSDAHKGTFGKTMIVAGSVNFTGAAHLAAMAAYRVGAGLVTLGVALSVHRILAGGSIEVTWLLLPEQLGVLGPEAVKVVQENLTGYDALLVGPGLTQEEETVRFVHQLLGLGEERRRTVGFVASRIAAEAEAKAEAGGKQEGQAGGAQKAATADERTAAGMGFLSQRRHPAFDPAGTLDAVKLVLDADALNALSQREGWHRHVPAHSILTPHPGEMARLCGCATPDVQANRVGIARSKAAEWNQVVLLKGAYTVVSAPDGRAAVLPFANPALATAGSGDVLAGAIVGLLSQGLESFEAAVLGGYLHGLAGQMAALDMGPAGVVAGDLLIRLPLAMRQLQAL